MYGKPRHQRSNATARDVRNGAEIDSPSLSAGPEGKTPGPLEAALTEALNNTERFAVIIVDLDTGLSKTAFMM